MAPIKKAVIPVIETGIQFLPFSKILPKEFFPLADKPAIRYLVEEVKASNIKKIIFITRTNKKEVLNYFKRSPKIEKLLKGQTKGLLSKELEEFHELIKNFSFSSVVQKESLGYGHAIFQAKKLIGQTPCAVLIPDHIIDASIPGIIQLSQVFKTCQKPVVALRRVSREKISSYPIAEVEKIASRLYKIKKIIEKPTLNNTSSDLAVGGRYILTPEAMGYLQKLSRRKPIKETMEAKEKITLTAGLENMLQDGKIIYGYEIDGEWLEYNDKLNWLKANLYLSLRHPEFGEDIKKFLNELN